MTRSIRSEAERTERNREKGDVGVKIRLGIMACGLASMSVSNPALAADTLLDGCQSEGCGCFVGVPLEAQEKEVPAIKTIRPFTLFKARDKAGEVLGKFEPGVIARPLDQKIVVHAKGRYRVEKVLDPATPVVEGDIVHTRIGRGEGFYKAYKDKTLVLFSPRQVVLKPIEATQFSEWLEIEVDGQRGFTLDMPFEGCLE
jgi:hypothetical protein